MRDRRDRDKTTVERSVVIERGWMDESDKGEMSKDKNESEEFAESLDSLSLAHGPGGVGGDRTVRHPSSCHTSAKIRLEALPWTFLTFAFSGTCNSTIDGWYL